MEAQLNSAKPNGGERRGKTCNGRALDRVTKQKHRPNRQKLSKKCPKIVFSAPSDNFWTFFGHFFDIFRTFCRHSHFLGCPMICPFTGQDGNYDLGHSPASQRLREQKMKGCP